ncbi:hypothetical protein GGI22_003480, partial [Coemansia erecta]
NLNPFDIPAWAFMAIIVSVVYLLGQVAVGFIASRVRTGYRKKLQMKESEKSPRAVGFNEYRSDKPDGKSSAATLVSSSSPSAKTPKDSGSVSKRTKTKKASKK